MSALRRIALVGLPGAGKSAVGSALARRLGWSFIDLDSEIERTAGRTAAEVLRSDGEESFRRLEQDALRTTVRGEDPVVIACGGGLPTRSEARALLRDTSCVVWLDAPDSVLAARLGDGAARPLLNGNPAAALPRLRSVRTAAYGGVAHLHASAVGPVEAVAGRIEAALRDAVQVPVSGRSYAVEVRPGALADIDLHLPAAAASVTLIADRRVAGAARGLASALRRSGRRVTTIGLVGGERVKTWSTAGRLLQRLARARLRRQDCIVALGGGTVGDLAGFVAATYLRGVAWVNVPTTLLAMVDSAVGGKTGVDLPQGKNLAGAVWQPRAVVCDTELVATLSAREYRAAFAEIVKYCMISEDGLVPLLDRQLEGLMDRDPVLVADVVRRSVAIKAAVVAADERESGLRAVLNYGHTVAHALEAATGFGPVNHGEALAVGLHLAGRLSVRCAGCPEDDIAWQDETLRRCGLAVVRPVDERRLREHMQNDKKATAAGVRWVLLERRGRPVPGHEVPGDVLDEVLEEVRG